MTKSEEKAKLHDRLTKREEQILSWINKLRRQIDAGVIGGEAGREFLDKYAVGNGLNIACGDFPNGEAIGVDPDPKKLAIDFWGWGDAINAGELPLDFIVTNYLEWIPQPLKLLQDWHKLLKDEGVIALVLRDADAYEEPCGPLANKSRSSCFTFGSICCYLERAGFDVFDTEQDGTELRIAARKK